MEPYTDRRSVLKRGAASLMIPTVIPNASFAATSIDAPSAVQPVTVYDLREIESRAKARLPKGPFDYIATGVGDGWTQQENLDALKRITLAPRFMTGKRTADQSVTLLGSKLSTPILIPPMGGHGMVHLSAEAGTALGAAAEGVLMVPSTFSTLPLEDIAKAAAGPKWFHVYLPADRGIARDLLLRAKAAGYTALVVTVDTAVPGNRTVNEINKFSPMQYPLGNFPGNKGTEQVPGIGWPDLDFIQATTGLPVLIKGVLGADLVEEAHSRGIAGLWVSNHGGRALDDTPATITALPRVVDAVGGRMKIVVDSGFRRGQDVFKGLALGADAVAIGRPILWGLTLGGWMGVQASLARIKAELEMTMRLMGVASIKEISREHLFSA